MTFRLNTGLFDIVEWCRNAATHTGSSHSHGHGAEDDWEHSISNTKNVVDVTDDELVPSTTSESVEPP